MVVGAAAVVEVAGAVVEVVTVVASFAQDAITRDSAIKQLISTKSILFTLVSPPYDVW